MFRLSPEIQAILNRLTDWVIRDRMVITMFGGGLLLLSPSVVSQLTPILVVLAPDFAGKVTKLPEKALDITTIIGAALVTISLVLYLLQQKAKLQATRLAIRIALAQEQDILRNQELQERFRDTYGFCPPSSHIRALLAHDDPVIVINEYFLGSRYVVWDGVWFDYVSRKHRAIRNILSLLTWLPMIAGFLLMVMGAWKALDFPFADHLWNAAALYLSGLPLIGLGFLMLRDLDRFNRARDLIDNRP